MTLLDLVVILEAFWSIGATLIRLTEKALESSVHMDPPL